MQEKMHKHNNIQQDALGNGNADFTQLCNTQHIGYSGLMFYVWLGYINISHINN